MKIVRKFLSLLLSGTLLMSSCGMVQAKKIIREDTSTSQATSQSEESSNQSTNPKISNNKTTQDKRYTDFERLLLQNYVSFRKLYMESTSFSLIGGVIIALGRASNNVPLIAIGTILTIMGGAYNLAAALNFREVLHALPKNN